MNTSSQIHSTPSLIGRVRGGSVWGLLSHSFALIREDKLFSAIYIAGTAVAIASAMVIAIVLNIMLANIYPETHRDRTLYVTTVHFKDSEAGGTYHGGCSTLAIDELFSRLECVEVATGVLTGMQTITLKDSLTSDPSLKDCIYCDPRFFQLYDFHFLEGRPFNEQEFRSHEPVCVITEALAHKLGASLGSTLQISNAFFRVVGIVEGASQLVGLSYAECYTPYFLSDAANSYEGDLNVRVLLKKGFSREDFLKEVEPLRRRYEATQTSAEGEPVHFVMAAHSHFFVRLNFFNPDEESATNKAKNLMPPAILMLIFLLLPALNLTGLVSNRMEARLPEMGIRKAFGAKRRTLLFEVIHENLVLTLCGGLVGWLLSWLFLIAVRYSDFVRVTFLRNFSTVDSVAIEFDMFFTPTLFLIVFLCCVVLNLMVALIPSWTSLRKPIVESLNQKK